MTPESNGPLIDNRASHRFELPIEGGGLAVAYYRLEGDRVLLTHTEVPEQFSGRGIGTKLARAVFDAVRASGRRVVPICSFMRAFAARHPEDADLIAD